MKFTCNRKELANALHAMTGVVNAGNHSLQPILENVKLSVMADGRLVLAATDLKTGIICVIETKGGEQGKTLVNFSRLFDVVKETPGEDFTFYCGPSSMAVVERDDVRFELSCEDAMKYPEVEHAQLDGGVSLDSELVLSMIQKTVFCTTAEKTRYDLDAVKINVQAGKLEVAATDGKRLALFEANVEEIGKIDVCVMASCLSVLRNALKSLKADKVEVAANANKIYFKTGNFELFTRLSEVKFPPYRRILPKSLKHTITFASKDSVASALRKVRVAKSKESPFVVIDVNGDKVDFRLESDPVKAMAGCRAEYDGPAFSAKFDLVFVSAAVENYSENKAVVAMTDGEPTSPLWFFDSGDVFDWTNLILPIKVEEPKGVDEKKEAG